MTVVRNAPTLSNQEILLESLESTIFKVYPGWIDSLVKAETRPHLSGNRVSVLDLFQIKGGLRLYLLLDLDY
jgi:hypothetical protein